MLFLSFFFPFLDVPLQYSWASLVAQLVENLPAMRETWVRSLGWEDPLEKGKASHSSILAWRIPWDLFGLPWWLRWKSVCPQCGRPRFNLQVGKIPWRRKWQPTPVLLPRKFHGWRSLVGYSPWGRKELDTTERFHFLFTCGSAGKESTCNAGDLGLIPGLGRSPGEGKGYLLQYSGLRIPWTVWSMGSQRIGHD